MLFLPISLVKIKKYDNTFYWQVHAYINKKLDSYMKEKRNLCLRVVLQ